MHDFILREIKNTDINHELENIGFDKSYVHKAVEKYNYKNIKIYSLTSAQANIIKQTAISVGCDCATHREVITGEIEFSNCILGGSISEIKKVGEKLKFQPFSLKSLGEKLCHYEESKGLNDGVIQSIENKKLDCFAYTHNDKIQKPKLVGILNITDNSFSDGGLYNDFESGKNHLLEMIKNGADIIDIGAESTKPYSSPVNTKEQLEKLLPIIDFAKNKITLSIDTRSAEVAEECLNAGAHIINDVSGFDYDNKMADIIAKHNVPIVLQHSKGTPENMQNSPQYNDIMEEIFLDLNKKINFAKSKGIEKIIIDPGIGFGKTKEHNFEIIRRVGELKSLNYPIMLGISRKSFLNLETNEEKDIYTTAINALAINNGIDFIRVHNVKMHKTLIDLMEMFMV